MSQSLTARLVLVAAVTCALPGAVLAQEGSALVRLDGRPLLRIAADSLPDPRAREVERRLEALVAAAEPPPEAEIRPGLGDTLDILVGNAKVIGVSADDAEENLLPQDSLARRWAHDVDSALTASRAARGTPLRGFYANVRAALRASLSRLTESSSSRLPGFLAALALLLGTWAVAAGLRRSMHLVSRRMRYQDPTVENLVRYVAFYTVWAIGIVLALDAIGVPVQTLVTGLGLTGLALGFALRDMISNFVSGLLLLATRPFTLGDEIAVGETEGRVMRIELRATEIRTFDGRTVIVPNADLLTSVVTNSTASRTRRGEVRFPIDYGDDIRRAMEQLRRSAEAVPGVAADPPVGVLLQELGENEVRVRVLFWTATDDLITMRNTVGLALIEGQARGGFALPSPQRRRVILGFEPDADFELSVHPGRAGAAGRRASARG